MPALPKTLAPLALALALLAGLAPAARADSLGPAFSGGDFPMLSWAAVSVPYNQPVAFYTVLAGKKLVVRTFCTNTSSFHMTRNGTQIVLYFMTTHEGDFAPLYCIGAGQMVFHAGETLGMGTNSSSTSTGGAYTVEATLYAE